MTNKDVYIGNQIYFLEATNHNGIFPSILRGRVQTITCDSVQIKLNFTHYTNEVWVDLKWCYPTAQELVKALYTHLMQQAYIVDNPDKEPR